MFFLFVSLVSGGSGGDLTIVGSSREYYPQSQNITLFFDVLDRNYTKLNDGNTSCDFYITNILGDEIISDNMNYDSGKEQWLIILNETHTAETGEYNCYIYCSSNITGYNGFNSFLFEITENGTYTESSVNFDMKGVFLIGLIILAFLLLIVGISAENIVFKITSAIVFVIDGLIFITTEIDGIDSKFTVGLGVILAIIGAFIAITTFKSD